MTDLQTNPMTVPAGERGLIRIFALSMPPEQARFLRDAPAMDQALGVSGLDTDYVEIIKLSDLEDLGLSGYLSEGCGVSDEQLAPALTHLDAMTGYVMVVFSQAFGGRTVHLNPDSALSLAATFSDEPVDWTATPIRTPSADPASGVASGSPRDRRSRARRTGGTVFAVFMVLIIVIILGVLL